MPTSHAVSQPVCAASEVTTGTSATIVPTDVPTDIDTKHAATNIPAGMKCDGTISSVSATVASTAPIALAEAANAPASTNIQTIYIMRESAAPAEKRAMRSLRVAPRIMATA